MAKKRNQSEVDAYAGDAWQEAHEDTLDFEEIVDDIVRGLGENNVHVRNIKLRQQTVASRSASIPISWKEKTIAHMNQRKAMKYIDRTKVSAENAAKSFVNYLCDFMCECVNSLRADLAMANSVFLDNDKYRNAKCKETLARCKSLVDDLDEVLANTERPNFRSFWVKVFTTNMLIKELLHEMTKQECASILEKYLGEFLHKPWRYPAPSRTRRDKFRIGYDRKELLNKTIK